MAYYFNNYPTYQPYQYQTMQQAPMVPTGIVWVNDYNEAAMYPVAPNGAVALWDKNNPSIYLKKADPTGRPMMQVFDLVERKQPAKQDDNEHDALYATKTDLRAVSDAVQVLREGLNEMRLKIENRASGEGVSE